MNIKGVVETLTVLREQMKAIGHAEDEFDELIMTDKEVRLKCGTRTMKIPLEARSCVGLR